jgi:uncharacterized Zn-finger protein
MRKPGKAPHCAGRAMRFRYGRARYVLQPGLTPEMTKLPDNPKHGSDDARPPRRDAGAGSRSAVTSKRVKCDGGGGALGHPVVYYDMGEEELRRVWLLRSSLRVG